MKTTIRHFLLLDVLTRRACGICLASLILAVLLFNPIAVRGDQVYLTGNNDDVYTYSPPGPASLFAQLPLFTNVEGLAFDTHGNLFVAGGADVHKVTPGGTVSFFAALPSSAGGYGLAIDHSNNLYVADSFIHQISKIDPSGTVSFFADLGSSGPTGLTLDDNGNVYACTAQTITKITSDGGTLSTYATLPLGSNNTYGLAFDADGYLYASDFFATSIYKINPGGGSFSNFGTISGAKGLIFDSEGNLYAANPNADLIYKITPDGTTTVFGTNLGNPRYLAFRPSSVPEPSAFVLMSAGMALFIARRRHRGLVCSP
jgi:hypothetical protein